MESLSHRLDRTLLIQARPETVFRFFQDNERWARWWGAGSTIDSRAGGDVLVVHPDGTRVAGTVLVIEPPERLVFTYGYENGKPIGPGASRVTIRLAPEDGGTRLHLTHEFSDAAVRDIHIQGWRFQLSVFANVVANEVFAGAESIVDAWYHAWTLAPDEERHEAFERVAAANVRFRDQYSSLEGLDEVCTHAGAALRFMPGITLARNGKVRQCQGTVLADWVATRSDGKAVMQGTSVFVLHAEGKIISATGIAG